MKKRIVAAFLCVLMLASVLVGCNDGYVSNTSTTNPMTVVIALVTDDVPTASTIELVEDELSAITNQLYNIEVELEIYSPDEYRSAMDRKFAALEDAFNDGTLGSSVAVGESYTENEFGRKEVVYPDTYENQVDIFLVNDPVMLREYADKEWLYTIDGSDGMASSDGEGALIAKYIPTTLRNMGMYNGALYAIPGNSVYGDYEYLLVDKELYSDYGTASASSIKSLSSIQDFLLNVAKCEADVTPLYNITDFGVTTVTGGKSVLAQHISSSDQSTILTSEFQPRNFLEIPEVKEQLAVVCALMDAGVDMPEHTSTVDFNENFAACIVTGTPDMAEKYSEDYYVVPISVPVATTSSIYDSMFGVSSFTSDTARTFKVLSLFYTNANFINTLLYGVENVHYTVTDSVVTKIEDCDYNMNRYGVGNVFLTKQSSDMTEKELALSANNWENAKKMSEALLLSPYLGFELDYEASVDGCSTKEIALRLEMLYEEIWQKLEEYPDALNEYTGESHTFDTFYAALVKELNANEYVKAALEKTDAANSFCVQYKNWFNIINPPEEVM